MVLFEGTGVRREGNAMQEFIAKFSAQLLGVLSGFDRLLIRGTLRAICYPQGMMGYRSGANIRLKDFGRRGMADFHRRSQVCQQINERYVSALARVDDDTTLAELTGPLQQPRRWKGRRVRALHPFRSPDQVWLERVNRGESALHGFRNRDRQALFFPPPTVDPKERRRRSAWLSRRIRLLRAHKLIRKVAGAHRYHVTPYGRKAITAILAAQQATLNRLTPNAA